MSVFCGRTNQPGQPPGGTPPSKQTSLHNQNQPLVQCTSKATSKGQLAYTTVACALHEGMSGCAEPTDVKAVEMG